MISDKSVPLFPGPARTLQSACTIEKQDSAQDFGNFTVPQVGVVSEWLPFIKPPSPNVVQVKCPNVCSNQLSEQSNSLSTSVCIESALIPDVAALSSCSSDSDWDCELLSRLTAPPKTAPTTNETNCELDHSLLQQPCPWLHDSSYESRLHSALQPPAQPLTTETPGFNRTAVQIVEVQH